MYAKNSYKSIPYSIDIGKSLQKSSDRNYTYNISYFGGMAEESSIRLKADVKVPGTTITFTVDTGKFTPQNVTNFNPPGWGNFDIYDGVDYQRGKVIMKINAASGSQYQNVKLLSTDKEVKTYNFTYPEIGMYYIEATIWEGTRGFGSGEDYINANQSSSLVISYLNQPPP